jgi:hypothetical protein
MARVLSPGFDGLGEAITQNLAPHYLELGSDLEVFAGEPIVWRKTTGPAAFSPRAAR